MAELGVELILARSPQAKGRVERMNGTFQDRLVKALRRLKIRDLDAANAFLEKTFLPQFNAHFEIPAAKAANVHQALPDDCDLGRVLSIQEERVVQNDWTVRWKNGFLQLEELGTYRCGPRSVSPSAKPWRARYGCFSEIANSRGPRCGRVRKPGGRNPLDAPATRFARIKGNVRRRGIPGGNGCWGRGTDPRPGWGRAAPLRSLRSLRCTAAPTPGIR